MSAGGGLHLHPLPHPPTHIIKKPDINYLLFCRQEAALLLKGVIYPPLELYLISNEQNCNEGDAVSCANTANTDKLKVIKSCCCLKRDNSHLCKSTGCRGNSPFWHHIVATWCQQPSAPFDGWGGEGGGRGGLERSQFSCKTVARLTTNCDSLLHFWVITSITLPGRPLIFLNDTNNKNLHLLSFIL